MSAGAPRQIALPERDFSDEKDKLREALREAAAILDAIEFGDLLAALPSDEEDRLRHQAGITLLERHGALVRECLALCRAPSSERERTRQHET
jgi:hypothetical protein